MGGSCPCCSGLQMRRSRLREPLRVISADARQCAGRALALAGCATASQGNSSGSIISSGSLAWSTARLHSAEGVPFKRALAVLVVGRQAAKRTAWAWSRGGITARSTASPWPRSRWCTSLRAAPRSQAATGAQPPPPPRALPWCLRPDGIPPLRRCRVRAEDGVLVVKSPKSGESLLSLQNFQPQFAASYAQTMAALQAAGLWQVLPAEDAR